MKTGIRIFILCLLICSATFLVPLKSSAQVSVSFQVFYDDLSPYGTWVNNSTYGYVWYPNVAAGFSPYGSGGYWVMTDAGWTWVSEYPWGWAPFHYGRWYSDPIYGPMWVPGNEWGPGWVTWRRSEGYYGWAPIEPGININVAYSNEYNVPHERWRFVRDRDFGRRDINNYYVNSSSNVTIIKSSTVINNVREDNSRRVKYNAGPDREEVQKRTGKQIAPVALKESDRPGENLNKGELQIYRPRVEKENIAGQKAAPAKVSEMKDLKPAPQRNVETQPQKANQSTKEQPKQQQKTNKAENGQTIKQPPTMQQPVNQQNKEPKIQQDGQKTNQPQHSQPKKEQPIQHQNSQPNKEQPVQHQPANVPVNKQPMDEQNNQHKKEQPSQQQQNNKQPNQQPSHQQNSQPAKEQPSQHKQSVQPTNQQKGQQQPSQNQHNNQQPQQRPVEQQKSNPSHEKPKQQQNNQPDKNQPAEQPSRKQEQPPQEHHPDKEGDQYPHE